MKLIAKKPCSFGGQRFYIGDEIPTILVADVRMQEKMGVITIANDTEMLPDGETGTFFTQEQLDKMVAEAVDEAVNNTVMEMKQKQKELQEAAAELDETKLSAFEETVVIPVRGEHDEENETFTAVPAKPEEIQQVFSIMQLNAEEGAKAIADVTSENVLILLHAADSRKTIKDAAKKQADKLFPIEDISNESIGGNETTETNTEGDDA